MRDDKSVQLFVGDAAVLSSLRFSLGLDGFTLTEGAYPRAARCLVIDQRYRGDGLAFLRNLRQVGITAPAVLLATNPTRRQHKGAVASGAVVIEKPLLDDELTQVLRAILGASPAPAQTAELKRLADS